MTSFFKKIGESTYDGCFLVGKNALQVFFYEFFETFQNSSFLKKHARATASGFNNFDFVSL